MNSEATIEDRLSAVEEQLAAVRESVAVLENQKQIHPVAPDWLGKITGSMKDIPDFEEFVKLGREIRQADRFQEEPGA